MKIHSNAGITHWSKEIEDDTLLGSLEMGLGEDGKRVVVSWKEGESAFKVFGSWFLQMGLQDLILIVNGTYDCRVNTLEGGTHKGEGGMVLRVEWSTGNDPDRNVIVYNDLKDKESYTGHKFQKREGYLRVVLIRGTQVHLGTWGGGYPTADFGALGSHMNSIMDWIRYIYKAN